VHSVTVHYRRQAFGPIEISPAAACPAPEQWESDFDANEVVESLAGGQVKGDAVEFGCGYGTFTIVAAPRIGGIVYALDIDSYT
jgi:cyclopropane fatty-acyl-phospholipid synthase-like methyltransferase